MERNGTVRNLENLKIDGKKWNWKEPGNLWKSQYQMEGNGIGRNLEISKPDGKKWNWKKPGNLKNRWEEMELE